VSRSRRGLQCAFLVAAIVADRSNALASGRAFLRGRIIENNGIQIGDAIRILSELFSGLDFVHCDDAADANDDGRVDISDALYLLQYLFLGTRAPPDPFSSCGSDPTPDGLGCARSALCPPCAERCAPPTECVLLGPEDFVCTSELTTCAGVVAAYELLTTGIGQPCNVAPQCEVLVGHCGVGLGGCFYAVSRSGDAAWYVSQEQLDALAARFQELGCTGPICRCAPPPEQADCIDHQCTL
jgi:hypothetical protein